MHLYDDDHMKIAPFRRVLWLGFTLRESSAAQGRAFLASRLHARMKQRYSGFLGEVHPAVKNPTLVSRRGCSARAGRGWDGRRAQDRLTDYLSCQALLSCRLPLAHPKLCHAYFRSYRNLLKPLISCHPPWSPLCGGFIPLVFLLHRSFNRI